MCVCVCVCGGGHSGWEKYGWWMDARGMPVFVKLKGVLPEGDDVIVTTDEYVL